ncbi:MAG: ABC transporter ATP-binding protein [Bacteroidales bacterium]|nr:ABC transporter ATP-binding protein [Bacteroidales bacterium]
MKPIIKIENLSKLYRLGLVGTGTLQHDLNRWWTTSVRGKEDPYLTVGKTNVISTRNSNRAAGELMSVAKKLESQYVWALKDINLDVNQGDVIGIIGKNGAGKSTLLKILSRVTKPTTGSIKYNGRIASLLEVGTGFHPEMTGRENIYMNGAIMGMPRAEITQKLDEIIDFAGVEKYIDTPVKRYSSGMAVRLGFSIAAHLEPDILVVDEVLAVGDAEFQKKALGKMQDVSSNLGRTVLFVSHNMASVKNLCNKGIILKNGMISKHGDVAQIIETYLLGKEINNNKLNFDERKGSGRVQIEKINIYANNNTKLSPFTGGDLHLDFNIKNHFNDDLSKLKLSCGIDDIYGNRLILLSTKLLPPKNVQIKNKVSFIVPKLPLNTGNYTINVFLILNGQLTEAVLNICSFYVEQGDYYGTGRIIYPNKGKFYVDFDVKYE